MSRPSATSSYTMLVFEHEPHYEDFLKLLSGPFINQSPIQLRPALMRFSLDDGTAAPAELHLNTFYSPFASLREVSPAVEINIKVKTLITATNRFMHRFGLMEHVEAIMNEACAAVTAFSKSKEVAISSVVNWLEHNFSILQGTLLGSAASASVARDLAITRVLLFFVFDAFVGITAVNVEELLHAINPGAIRAVIERDPVFSDSNMRSVRSSYIEQLCQLIKSHDQVSIFAHVVEGSLMDTYTGEFRTLFTPELIELARTLLGRYQFGTPLALNDEPRQDLVQQLVSLEFVSASGRLAQHTVDRLWLNECLTKIFSESALGSGPRRGNRLTYVSTSTLLEAISLSSMIVYNGGGQAEAMMSELSGTCRYVSLDPFSDSITCNNANHPDAQNIFLISNAQYSTIHHITEKLRTMYSDYSHGAPLYCRNHVNGGDYSPPRLVIEFDPYFSSDSVAWFEAFVKSLEQQRPTLVFYCMVAPHAPASDGEGLVPPSGADNLKLRESRFQLGRLFAGGEAKLKEGFIQWLQSHCATFDTTPPDAVIHESVGGWLVERRIRAANGKNSASSSDFEAEVFLSESALLAHRDHWIQALYIAASNSALSFAVVTEDPGTLIQRLVEVRAK